MDLEPSDDQVALRDGIRALLTDRFPMARVRGGFTREVHDELAAAGVFTLLRDGFAWADAAIVVEQLGEFLVPGPLVGTLLAATLAEASSPAGRVPVVGVLELDEPAGTSLVEHLALLDDLLVLSGDDVHRVDVAAPSDLGPPVPWPLDPLTPLWPFARERADVRASWRGAAPETRRRGAVLTAAFLVGMAQRLTDLSVAHATSREQFGRVIGSFQAVKHLLADMAVRTEVARAAVYAAAAHLDEPAVAGLDRAVAVAKLTAGEAAIANGTSATQVHGGMGFTWEVDVHLSLKRAWLLDTHFGSIDAHADGVADDVVGAASGRGPGVAR
jgi:alkylation response protein AidB-like acyl-CoA dehydrogenase